MQCKDFPIGAVLWIMVADGAGSATHGGLGADIAANSLSSRIARYLAAMDGDLEAVGEELIQKWIRRTRHQLLTESESRQMDIRQLACTLLGIIVGPARVIAFQIGDGAIVTANETGEYHPIFWPEAFDYANVTAFLTQKDFADHLQFHSETTCPQHVAVFSDGIQRLSLSWQDRTVHAPFFHPMFARLATEPPGYSLALKEPLIHFLSSPPLNSRTDDDKTLVLATNQTAVTQ